MATAESLVAQIQGLSSNAVDLGLLSIHLKKADEVLHNESTRLLAFLEQLDPTLHSLGYLYFLEACTSGPVTNEQARRLVLILSRFLTCCVADQIRLASEKFIAVSKRFKDQVLMLEVPMRGVAPLLEAVKKLRSSSEYLTALHPDFLQLCLLAKCYKTGLSILEDDIFEVDQPRDFFLYCYYGGMICIGQKHFQKALELLHNVVTAPMSSINAIAVEAFKKYILVSLIQNRQFSTSLPKYTSSAAQRNLKTLCQDNNHGLVKQVVSSMYKRNIQRLTQTYLTLSLQDIAKIVQLSSPKEAEMHVLQMIQDGEIYATINQKDGMVRFLEDPEQYKNCEMIEHIDSSIQRIMTLSKKLTAVDELLSCDPLYLAKAGRERQRFDFDDFDPVPQKFNI
ncbi:COP9 signalosome complex subunit 3 isoform X2 [Populus trichocarpa]|uniref:COP9 signalosome complex subunit 3 isoform X2 n=1 Tax=Populus trichocarpa TaxID=3694 RepID=UPI000D18B171|nr:COP9 signalosome complex subunit 3 isoform X2 [Populus trichocarpa]|eukprot:XP_024444191.1 COP9 signalosome complex subunit 3-like isoform X2 [Populus trichocarpa]